MSLQLHKYWIDWRGFFFSCLPIVSWTLLSNVQYILEFYEIFNWTILLFGLLLFVEWDAMTGEQFDIHQLTFNLFIKKITKMSFSSNRKRKFVLVRRNTCTKKKNYYCIQEYFCLITLCIFQEHFIQRKKVMIW